MPKNILKPLALIITLQISATIICELRVIEPTNLASKFNFNNELGTH